MSAALEPEARAPSHEEPPARAPLPRSSQVDDVVRRLDPVDLPALEASAALLTRVDRKYVVTVEAFHRLVAGLDDEWRALEIGAARLFGYTSVYFDTPDLATYRAHLQGRRRRYKIRVRRYDDSSDCMLEVKRKGLRGLTVKDRTRHDARRLHELGRDGRAFVEESLRDYAVLPDGDLLPVVTTTNLRATLVHPRSRARLTVDTGLRCGWGEDLHALGDDYVVLESKSANGVSEADRLLHRLGERPSAISKFCIGVAALGLDVPVNPWRRTLRRYFESPAA